MYLIDKNLESGLGSFLENFCASLHSASTSTRRSVEHTNLHSVACRTGEIGVVIGRGSVVSSGTIRAHAESRDVFGTSDPTGHMPFSRSMCPYYNIIHRRRWCHGKAKLLAKVKVHRVFSYVNVIHTHVGDDELISVEITCLDNVELKVASVLLEPRIQGLSNDFLKMNSSNTINPSLISGEDLDHKSYSRLIN